MYERIYWNSRTYGTAKRIRKRYLKAGLISLGIIIPLLVPVPLVMWLSKFIKNDFVIRY